VAVFIGHDTSALPVGIPISIEATPQGLKTETKIFDGPAGDNLLAVAKGLRAAGQTLGLSIGYRVTDSTPERVNGKLVRKLTGIDLVEYSFAARQSIANPRALVTGVKAGAGMSMTVEQQDDGKYHVMKGRADDDGRGRQDRRQRPARFGLPVHRLRRGAG
jgi:phage head maturation protease